MKEQSLKLQLYPNEILASPCAAIAEITPAIKELADQMLAKMYALNGLGLAAPQVGHALQLLCIDVSEDQSQPLQLMNPKILATEGEIDNVEGCLSLPGLYLSIKRAERVQVQAETFEGTKIFWADDLLAICLQHEIDHLHGKTMLDHLSPLKRERALIKFKKLQTQKDQRGE